MVVAHVLVARVVVVVGGDFGWRYSRQRRGGQFWVWYSGGWDRGRNLFVLNEQKNQKNVKKGGLFVHTNHLDA